MLTLRCTQKLVKRLRLPAGPAVDPPASTTILGDWYANVIVASPSHLVLCVAERSRLCVVVPAIQLRTQFPERLRSAVRRLLHDIGIPPDTIDREIAQMEDTCFAPASGSESSRSLLGTLNDFTRLLQADMRRYSTTVGERGRIISCTPCGALGLHSPDEIARDLMIMSRIANPVPTQTSLELDI